MERVIEYSDVFSFEFGSTASLRQDINELKEELSDKLNLFLDLGFSDAFLFVMSETHNDGEVKVYTKSFGMDIQSNSLPSIQDFMAQVSRMLRDGKGEKELELAYHVTTKSLSFFTFNEVFDDYSKCKTFKDYIDQLSSRSLFLADCFVREELATHVAFTPNSHYIIKCQNGNSFECQLLKEELLILPDFDDSDENELDLSSFDEEMLFD